MNNSQLLLTPSDVAERLKLNSLTIYKYIRRGELKAAKFGRTYRISEKDLENFINENKVVKIK